MEVRDHGSFDVKLVREFTPPLEVLGLAPRHVRLNRRPANEKQVLGSIFFLTSELTSGTPAAVSRRGSAKSAEASNSSSRPRVTATTTCSSIMRGPSVAHEVFRRSRRRSPYGRGRSHRRARPDRLRE